MATNHTLRQDVSNEIPDQNQKTTKEVPQEKSLAHSFSNNASGLHSKGVKHPKLTRQNHLPKPFNPRERNHILRNSFLELPKNPTWMKPNNVNLQQGVMNRPKPAPKAKTPTVEDQRKILFPDNSPVIQAQQRKSDRFKGHFTIRDEVATQVQKRSDTLKNLSDRDIANIAEQQARSENRGFMNMRREAEIRKQLEQQKRDARRESSFDKARRIQEETQRRQENRWKF